MSLWIDCHGLGAIFGLNGLHLAKFVSRVLVEDVDFPSAARGKHHVGIRIKDVGVHSVADGEGLKDFAAIRIHHY